MTFAMTLSFHGHLPGQKTHLLYNFPSLTTVSVSHWYYCN